MNYLVIQANYLEYQVGLYKDTQQIALLKGDKKYSSKELVPTINTILKQHNLALNDLNGIGVNQGPGPFTSLRVAITTANGIAFGSHIQLIGNNSLHALLQEYPDNQYPLTIAILNAFNKDLYYAIQQEIGTQDGCKNIEILFQDLKRQFPEQTIRFIGNGTTMYKDLIEKTFGKYAFIPDPCPQEASLAPFASMTLKELKLGNTVEMLKPIYLKQLVYKPLF